MDRQNGIWNPKGFDSTLSITKTLDGPYADQLGGAVQKYSYERLPNRPLVGGRNIKLRTAAASGVPLVLFEEVRTSLYIPHYPVYIARDDPKRGYVEIVLDESLRLLGDPLQFAERQRRYAERVVQVRLHQKSFRSRVLRAYKARCAVCGLAHAELLDAAHITPDGWEDSTTDVANGLALCKLHHAAYDCGLIGIDPGYRVHVRQDVRNEEGGLMLRFGLQEIAGCILEVPRRIVDRPDPNRLQIRFDYFSASRE
ncbi:HNH endonuclease [Microbacterium sp. LMC-P-041]|uniref:HNH endonuclease n=1 Tax=Microbacterium sp. LMC-P-041 TaxID=3040293 RepID=UPI0033062680